MSSQWTSHSLSASRHKRLRLASMLRTFFFVKELRIPRVSDVFSLYLHCPFAGQVRKRSFLTR